MAIVVTCECGRRLKVNDEFAGRRVKCPNCEAVLLIPDQEEETEAAPPPRRRRRPDDRKKVDEYPDETAADEEEDEAPARRRRKKRRSTQISGKAIASLIVALFSCVCGLGGIPAVILGILALRNIGDSNGRLTGKGFAFTGIAIGGLLSIVWIGCIVKFGGLGGIQRTREAANQLKAQSYMRQIALAMHEYHDANGRFPTAVMQDPGGQPYSWRVALLPYLEEASLYNQYRRNEPWDSQANRAVLARMPRVYSHSGDPVPDATYYQVFVGPGAAFEASTPLRLQNDFPDGTSNTLLLVEATEAVPWTKPADLTYLPGGPLPALGRPYQDTFNAVFTDGSAAKLKKSITEANLRALITRNGGEAVIPDLVR